MMGNTTNNNEKLEKEMSDWWDVLALFQFFHGIQFCGMVWKKIPWKKRKRWRTTYQITLHFSNSFIKRTCKVWISFGCFKFVLDIQRWWTTETIDSSCWTAGIREEFGFPQKVVLSLFTWERMIHVHIWFMYDWFFLGFVSNGKKKIVGKM